MTATDYHILLYVVTAIACVYIGYRMGLTEDKDGEQ